MFDDFDFDAGKDEANFVKHGLRLSEFRGFIARPTFTVDARFDYGERRYQAFGRIDGLGYMVAFTFRSGRPRIFSFRRAHEKEMRRHEQ
jgi:uncharacterized protein